MTTVDLGVVSYRDTDSLTQLLSSGQGFDRTVVVNVTADEAVSSVCRQWGVTEVAIGANVGFAAAVNELGRRSESDFLLFTNDDTVFMPDVAERCRARARREAVVVPVLVSPDGRRQRSVRALPTPTRVLLEWVLMPDAGPDLGLVQKWRAPDEPERIKAATAAAVLVEPRLLRELPMPEDYFMYWEELEWFWCLHDKGVQVWMEPDIEVIRPDGREEFGVRKWSFMGANLVRLGANRWGRCGALVYGLLAGSWILRLMATDMRDTNTQARWTARRAAMTGIAGELRRSVWHRS